MMRWMNGGCGRAVALGVLAAVSAGESCAQGAGESRPATRPQQPEAEVVAPKLRPRPVDQEALFALFRSMRGLEARFAEEKELALLAIPLKSTGAIYFLPPGYLARRVETPQPQSVTITPTELRASDKNGEEVIDLRQSADVRLFVTSLVQVFAGNEEALAASYRVAYAAVEAPIEKPGTQKPGTQKPGTQKPGTQKSGEPAPGSQPTAKPEAPPGPANGWTLTLTPKEKPLTEMMRSLQLVGEGQAVVRIEVVDPNGDRTTTRILEANPAREFSPKEKAELFGIETR